MNDLPARIAYDEVWSARMKNADAYSALREALRDAADDILGMHDTPTVRTSDPLKWLATIQKEYHRQRIELGQVIASIPKECCYCGCQDGLEWGPDPYAEEIGGDDTPVWECGPCRESIARDI